MRSLCSGHCACYSHTRSEDPKRPGAVTEPEARRWSGPQSWPLARGALPPPVTVSPLSLTVCSQLDFFCPGVKGFSPPISALPSAGGPSPSAPPTPPCLTHLLHSLASSVVLNSFFRPMVVTIVISPGLHILDVTDFLQTCRGRHTLNTVKM